jgi:hypothetical protein
MYVYVCVHGEVRKMTRITISKSKRNHVAQMCEAAKNKLLYTRMVNISATK